MDFFKKRQDICIETVLFQYASVFNNTTLCLQLPSKDDTTDAEDTRLGWGSCKPK